MLKGTHDMYTVLTNPPIDYYTAAGWRIQAAKEDWRPIYKRQSITELAQRMAKITEFDELHYKLSWSPPTSPIIVLKNDIKDWLNEDSQQWEDGNETHKLILPRIPELLKDPTKINAWAEVIEKGVGYVNTFLPT